MTDLCGWGLSWYLNTSPFDTGQLKDPIVQSCNAVIIF